MKTSLHLALATSFLVSACATDGDANEGAPVDCGTEGLAMAGAFAIDTLSVATVSVDNRVIGVGGFGAELTTSYALTVVDILGAELDSPGVHDVADEHIKYLVAPASADCQAPGNCTGFVARAGTFDVHQTSPYRASFVLQDLYAYDGSTADVTQALAGQVTGCVATVQ